MTSRPTGNEKATLDQIVRLSVAGCELVRVSLVAGGPFALEAARATGARPLPVDAL
jgi:4-hydroxy-3-methylbut-2-en-1-yl diphosphate synthase IspG/GcpE